MDKKIIGLDAFKLYGKDALTKNDDELYKSTLKNFVCNNPDEARALINMLEDLKEESEQNNVTYEELVEREFLKLIEGVHIDEKNKTRFIKILEQNNITKYAIRNGKFIFINYNDYNKAILISKNINE